MAIVSLFCCFFHSRHHRWLIKWLRVGCTCMLHFCRCRWTVRALLHAAQSFVFEQVCLGESLSAAPAEAIVCISADESPFWAFTLLYHSSKALNSKSIKPVCACSIAAVVCTLPVISNRLLTISLSSGSFLPPDYPTRAPITLAICSRLLLVMPPSDLLPKHIHTIFNRSKHFLLLLIFITCFSWGGAAVVAILWRHRKEVLFIASMATFTATAYSHTLSSSVWCSSKLCNSSSLKEATHWKRENGKCLSFNWLSSKALAFMFATYALFLQPLPFLDRASLSQFSYCADQSYSTSPFLLCFRQLTFCTLMDTV